MKYQKLEEFLDYVKERNPGQPEFHQAVAEVMESLWPYIAKHPRYAEHGLLDAYLGCRIQLRAVAHHGIAASHENIL